MFLTASKTAVVEAMRAVYDDEYAGDIAFQSIDIEYPDQEYKWPACLVQMRLDGPVQWTGINPNHYEFDPGAFNDVNPGSGKHREIRLGDFRGSFDFTVLSLTSHERDRLWDGLVELFLFGDMRSDTRDFFETIGGDEDDPLHDLVRMTPIKDQVQPMGDSIGPGVPWDNTLLAYEATLRVPVIGQFAADTFTHELYPVSALSVWPYKSDDPVPGEGDEPPVDDGPGPDPKAGIGVWLE